jgi:hypothetical protein
MTDDLAASEERGGLTRRSMLQRSAVVGGTLVWAAPIVQSVGPAAFATVGSPGLISYVDVLIKCGTGSSAKYYAVTFDGSQNYKLLCKATISQDDARCQTYWSAIVAGKTVQTGCPPAGSITGQNVNGNLVVTVASTCSLQSWMVHDGGCQGTFPGQGEPKCFAPGHLSFSYPGPPKGKSGGTQTCTYTYPTPAATNGPSGKSYPFTKPCADPHNVSCH